MCVQCACGAGIVRGHLCSQFHLYMVQEWSSGRQACMASISPPPTPSPAILSAPLYPFARAECLSTLLLIKDDQLSLGRLILIDKTGLSEQSKTLFRQADAILASLVPIRLSYGGRVIPSHGLPGPGGISVVPAHSGTLHTMGRSHHPHLLTDPFASMQLSVRL